MKYCVFIICLIALVAFASAKPPCVGCPVEHSKDDLKKSEEVLKNSLSKLAAGDGPFYTLKKINSASTQVVAGIKEVINAELIDNNDKEKTCLVTIWSRPWLNPNGTEISFKCPGEETITKTYD